MKPRLLSDIIFVLVIGILYYLVFKGTIIYAIVSMIVLFMLISLARKISKRYVKEPKIAIVGSYAISKSIPYMFGVFFLLVGLFFLIRMVTHPPSFLVIIIDISLFLAGFSLIYFNYKYWKHKK